MKRFWIALVCLLSITTASAASYSYVMNTAPDSLDGHNIRATYLYASSSLRAFLGRKFQTHFGKKDFKQSIKPPTKTKTQTGSYTYKRLTPEAGEINLKSKHHRYQMILDFYAAMGGTFRVRQGSQVIATGIFLFS